MNKLIKPAKRPHPMPDPVNSSIVAAELDFGTGFPAPVGALVLFPAAAVGFGVEDPEVVPFFASVALLTVIQSAATGILSPAAMANEARSNPSLEFVVSGGEIR
jgi:hypothetical protein